jgi:GNAT superfamily N-acetyltransferase
LGLTPVPNGQLATVVTSLEMRERPRLRPLPESPLRLVDWKRPDPDKYRALFRRVGAPWLWFSRLVMPEERLLGILHDPKLAVSAVVDPRGIEVGMLELDFREPGQAELAFFGLVPELAGQGHGKWLMAQALHRAWTSDVHRVWVHTCTLDHPAALGFYIKSGFTPYHRAIETFADPRLDGTLPADVAPQIPCLGALAR